jgi:hypothetical protein
VNATNLRNRGRIGHRRLFVPLASEPYQWFASGRKTWEVRRAKSAFAPERLFQGRRVELRRGYSGTTSALWGTIVETVSADTLNELFALVPPAEVVPDAADRHDAVSTAAQILRSGTDDTSGFVAFRVKPDGPGEELTRISLAPEYGALVTAGTKTTTIRRGHKRILPGPALLCSGGGLDELLVAVTAVIATTLESLDDSDAHKDGFADRQELLDALYRHYPDIESTEPVTILEFKWINA